MKNEKLKVAIILVFCVKGFCGKVCIDLRTKANEFVEIQIEAGDIVTFSRVKQVLK